jgi:hypothetical protein
MSPTGIPAASAGHQAHEHQRHEGVQLHLDDQEQESATDAAAIRSRTVALYAGEKAST